MLTRLRWENVMAVDQNEAPRGILLHSGFLVAVTNVHFDLHPLAQEATTTSFGAFG